MPKRHRQLLASGQRAWLLVLPMPRCCNGQIGGDLGDSGLGLDEWLCGLTDANMNVTALVDTGGDAVERYIYDPYGKVTILNGANGVDKDGAVTEWTEDGDQTASDVDNANPLLRLSVR